MVKLPDKDPFCVTQAEELTRADEVGLEKVQVVSVGRKPVPEIAMSDPVRALPVLKSNTG